MKSSINITVAGLGFVGLSLACLLSKHNDVVAIDINEHRVADINNDISPIKDAYIESYLADRPSPCMRQRTPPRHTQTRTMS